MRRQDAERSVKELDGLDWGGSVLRVGWSKSMPLPSRAIYGTFSISFCFLDLKRRNGV